MQELRKFDPAHYLIRLNGADYLEVKWRVAWLRAEHPDARIETDLADVSSTRALFRARVSVPGGGSATGWGSETRDDFGEFIEKAETRALGRALAALGYGSQFCLDFESDGVEPVVDAPVRLPSFGRPRRSVESTDQFTLAAINQAVTARQRNFIYAIAREKGMTDEDVHAEMNELFGITSMSELDRRHASSLIEALQSRENVAIAS